MKNKIILFSILIISSLSISAKQKKTVPIPEKVAIVTDTLQNAKGKEYNKIVAGAKVVKGLFTVYKTKTGGYFFEIPDSLLGRDMLVAARVVNISDNNKMSAGQRRTNPILISFSRRDKLLFMHQPTGNSLAKASDPISVSLANNNVVPVVMTFDIAARNASNDASVVEVTKLFSSEFDLVFPAGIGNTGKLDTKASQIVEIKSFPKNVEIKSFYNYNGGREPFAVTINYSFVLLSKIPMRPRLNDDRISYSAENKRFYESGKPSSSIQFIDRWHIEPLAEDLEKYKKGEMVAPQKQIVFYVDTVMPEKWRGYIKQGIETWNAAFEKIGFKNVIKAIDFPRDKNFDPDDIRNNCFRYVTSTDANAQGPQWIDPRTSEIIQGDILWWHNVIDLLQTWRFVQTAAADPDARKKVLSDEIMGDAIRYAVAHEMGHVLGLQHNMRGSFAYPTDSLRSASFTQKYGTTASIMDYARNNYVAQPGDKEKGVRLTPPLLGPYDYFSIAWGYKPIFEANTSDEEVTTLNKWFIEKGNNPIYYNGTTTVSPVVPDPAAQSDALGNDLIKSANYGISNLKLITKNLVKWTMEEGDDFELLKKRFDAITKLHFRLSNLPLSYLGGAYSMYGTYGQHDAQIIPVEKSKQKETIRFIINGLVDYQWLNQPEINKQIGSATEEIMKWQSGAIGHMFGNFILSRIAANEALYSQNPYSLEEYLKDVDNQIWAATTKNQLTAYERNIQLTYIDRLCALIRPMLTPNDKQDGRSVNETTWASAAATQLALTRVRVAQLLVAQPQHAGHYKLILNIIDKTTK